MKKIEIIRQTITYFCKEFIDHPYLCYTEHGQHALFYSKLYAALPEGQRYITCQQQKVCTIQKEYPTAAKLGKPRRQHWDIAVLQEGAAQYDYINLLAAIEFGMNEAEEHLLEDIRRLDHSESNVENGFVVHLYRLSQSGQQFSGRDWSPGSSQILTREQVREISERTSVEIYYGMADSTGTYENGIWLIKNGQISKLSTAMRSMSKPGMSWEQLNSNITSCHLCEGLNSVELGTLNAPGYGDINSKIVFIGQSLCGKPCIESQIPFTGGSGKLLDQAMNNAGVNKKEIYITNVVKCHPPNNRKSEENEIINCTPYLKQELEWISPEHIICLGKDAWGFFNKAISSPCQKKVKMNGSVTTIHFVYHPSFIKRKPKEQQEIYIDSISEIIKSCKT